MYEQLAHLYDNAVRDIFSVEAAAVTLSEIDRDRGPKAQRPSSRSALVVTDLACGTGLLSWLVAGYGPRVVGVDVAPAMIEVARERAAPVSVPAQTTPPQFLVEDILTFAPSEKVDFALCFGDVVNHLLEEKRVSALFEATRRTLKPKGVFILDATTLATFESFLWNSKSKDVHEDGTQVITKVSFDAATELAVMQFTSTKPDGTPQVEFVRERFYADDVITRLLKDAGFNSVETRSWRPLASVSAEVPLAKTIFVAHAG